MSRGERVWRGALVGLVLALGPSCVRAEEVALLRPAAGVFEFNLNSAAAGELGLQYRLGQNTGPIHPLIGVFGTTDAAFLFYAGFGVDIPVGGPLYLRPSLAPAFYHRGEGKDLGSIIEFRSALELAWRTRRGLRLGIELDHVSNAGSAPSNRGAESLTVAISIPVGGRSHVGGGVP
jgi:hypothetical protein